MEAAMNTLALPLTARRTLQPRRPIATPADAPRRGWIERLAAWADRQPSHHRLGRWTAV
jgi:hypothetical protein